MAKYEKGKYPITERTRREIRLTIHDMLSRASNPVGLYEAYVEELSKEESRMKEYIDLANARRDSRTKSKEKAKKIASLTPVKTPKEWEDELEKIRETHRIEYENKRKAEYEYDLDYFNKTGELRPRDIFDEEGRYHVRYTRDYSIASYEEYRETTRISDWIKPGTKIEKETIYEVVA